MAKKKKDVIFPILGNNCRLIDTHCHLDMSKYHDDLDEVIERAASRGVDRIITVGIDLQSSREAINISKRYRGVYATVGIHPHNVSNVIESDYKMLSILTKKPKVVAYGEIGIDLHYNYAPKDDQIDHMFRQIELAKTANLPIIIHDREAHREVIDVLKESAPFPAGGVMHCFSGDSEFACQVLELGLYISIPGVVTFNKAEILQAAVKKVPLDKLILETDGPFLAPEPRRGRRNEPAFILFTAMRVAELKGIDLEDVARTTTRNAEKLFRLS